MSVEVFGITKTRYRIFSKSESQSIWADSVCEDGASINTTIRIPVESFILQMRELLNRMEDAHMKGVSWEDEINLNATILKAETNRV